MTAPAPSNRRPHRLRGLTFLEVVVAASILAIAALGVLELLASSDRAGLTARRQALAVVEAERALAACADAIRRGRDLPATASLQAGMRGEALDGCTVAVTITELTEEFVIPPRGRSGDPRVVDVDLILLVATVETANGEVLVTLERAVPAEAF
jgi:type II secretory pathway pseudopilin PulG